jgi:DEAD/DEAH box helicase domain-containing protein
MNLAQIIDHLRNSPKIRQNFTDWRVIPARPPRYAQFLSPLNPKLKQALQQMGIEKLYTHQAQALQLLIQGKNVAVVTPTASGKTLCYNLPVLDSLLGDPNSRAIYIFPTKALSQDQVNELQDLNTILGGQIRTFTYDGDTPPSARRAIRTAGQIVVTNPDMLHKAILPHHTKWLKLFENLQYVIIDEMHNYRGVFGSHLANIIRRLKRISKFYGSNPQFVLCSATIANPQELAQRIVEEEVELVDDNGAPSGEKHFLLYNPSLINKALGIRKSSLAEARNFASLLLENGVQTIAFARSRLRVEVLLTYLREAMRKAKKSPRLVRGYRGGYLPLERRAIEKGLREGEVLGVVSTNALELGIDIGQLDACIIAGYPGSISSTWQQAGRAGRRTSVSLAILVATSSPLDQYLINHPDYFFGQSPEAGIVDPNNLVILTNHLKCAAFEIPFEDGENYGVENTADILRYLEENRVLHHAGTKWHWMSDSYPAEEISLRTAGPGNFVILDAKDRSRVIGECDYFSAPMLIHEGAIYLHESLAYQIRELDWEGRKAYAEEASVDYYTDANLKTNIQILDVFKRENRQGIGLFQGEVNVTTLVTMYKKIKLHTHENVGWGKLSLPEQSMHTTSFWLEFGKSALEELKLSPEDFSTGLKGLSNLLGKIVPLFIISDPRDIRSVPMVRSPFSQLPTIYIYDNYPGGVGFSEKIYNISDQLLQACLELVQDCACKEGCPSCVGPPLEVGDMAKENTLSLIKEAMGKL